MSIQINKEDYTKPWRPGIYPKSTTVIYNNQLWILNDAITGLFSSSDFMVEVANGDWIGRYTTEEDLSTKLDKVSTAGVGRAYIINADGSQGTKATSEFGGSLESDPIFQASEANLFVVGDKENLDNQSGVNTGDETTTSIQTKRPLKTINSESLEGSGNIEITNNLPILTENPITPQQGEQWLIQEIIQIGQAMGTLGTTYTTPLETENYTLNIKTKTVIKTIDL